MAAVSDVPDNGSAESGGWRAASFFLEVAFHLQKATSKLLNNAFYATLCCQIKKLPWSDNHLAGSFERP
jgi:hypothetical protein